MPTLFILGGVNGAGKSTLAQAMLRSPVFKSVAFLNADVNAAQLRAGRPELTVEAANFLGLRMVAEATERLLDARCSFMTETVLASVAHQTLALRAHEAGYKVRLVYVAVASIEDSIARVARRVAKGGHDVPEKDLRRRWERSHDALTWFAGHTDEVRVFDNSVYGRRPVMVARVVGARLAFCAAVNLPAVETALAKL